MQVLGLAHATYPALELRLSGCGHVRPAFRCCAFAQVVEDGLCRYPLTVGCGCLHRKARFIEPDNRVDPLAGDLGESHRYAVRFDRLRHGHRVASELNSGDRRLYLLPRTSLRRAPFPPR